MTSTVNAVDVLVSRVGLDRGRVWSVAKKLTEAAILPSGGPRRSPELTPQDVAKLVLGAALDVPLRAVAETVHQYRALRREGVPEGAPTTISGTAGEALDILAEIAATGSQDAKGHAAKTIITVVNSWPEIVLTDTIDVRRFHAGMPGHWQAYGHRKSVEINGAAFADAIRDLFGDNQ